MAGINWISDFDWEWGRLRVKKTGAVVPFSKAIRSEVLTWFEFYFAVRRAPREPGARFTIAFAPDRPRPWYLIWPVLRLAGARFTDDAARADVVMQFEDVTRPGPVAPPAHARGRLLNFACNDVSKSRVTAAFEKAFGYSLAVDPATHIGEAVEKSEENGAHDGRIVMCPTSARAGCVYQRVVDNRVAGRPELVEDIRTPTVGGRPPVVFLKRRRVSERFANANVEVVAARPEDVYSQPELDSIAEFTRLLGLDWGGLDVLRDAKEGRLYIVDANKTDMGPPIALPLADKLDATRIMARAFRAFVTGAAQTDRGH
ncbi:MAG: hypothetical protein IV086_03495 [Hyphomonadaceae bacterium]|nr:MAG: hypothetical protein FD160_694 [Caulobacteraceae bacterium]MBT9444746.1 hypothetical protein [Hyphomonadaceae bacterium]TPW05961.1 MAG: hypothetical protein FD124_1929 [Alphaproteobacteria bacterium]